MPVPSPRSKLLPARGNYADLAANVSELLDGEICYALDEDQYYQKEGSVLVSVGATKAQGALADTALQDAPSNGSEYVRKDGQWAIASGGGGGGGIAEAPVDGNQYARQNAGWTQIVAGGSGPASTDELPEGSTNKYFPEAPQDSNEYVRKNGAWEVATGGGGGGAGQPTVTWTLTANGNTSYLFAGPGFSAPTPNPDLVLVRGQTYVFDNISGAHPFEIRSSGSAYSNGVTNNGVVGTVTFVVPFDAPAQLTYHCTAHVSMNGNLTILDPATDAPAAPVDSVNGQTGAVVLGVSDLNDYADDGEPVSDGSVLTYDAAAGKYSPVAPSGGATSYGPFAPSNFHSFDSTSDASQASSDLTDWAGPVTTDVTKVGVGACDGRDSQSGCSVRGAYANGNGILTGDAFTISFWYRHDNVTSGGIGHYIIGSTKAGVNTPSGLNIKILTNDFNLPQEDIDAGIAVNTMALINGSSNTGFLVGAPGLNAFDDTWHHYTYSHDGNGLYRMFLDGALVYTKDKGSPEDFTDAGIYGDFGTEFTLMGCRDDSCRNYGILDNFAVWNDTDWTAGLDNIPAEAQNNPVTTALQFTVAPAIGATTDLSDWSKSPAAPGQVPVYDGSAYAPTTLNLTTDLAGLTDVALTSPQDGETLSYDSASGTWINAAGGGGGGSVDTLSDTAITAPSLGDALSWDGTQWVNKKPLEAGLTKVITAAQITACHDFEDYGTASSGVKNADNWTEGRSSFPPSDGTIGEYNLEHTDSAPANPGFSGTLSSGNSALYIEFWFKHTGVGASGGTAQHIFGMGDSSNGASNGADNFVIELNFDPYSLSGGSSAYGEWGYFEEESVVVLKEGPGDNQTLVGTKNLKPTDGKWHHIAFVQEASTDTDTATDAASGIYKCFVDGMLVDEFDRSTVADDNGTIGPVDVNAGGYTDYYVAARKDGSNVFRGDMDNFYMLGGGDVYPYQVGHTAVDQYRGNMNEDRTFFTPTKVGTTASLSDVSGATPSFGQALVYTKTKRVGNYSTGFTEYGEYRPASIAQVVYYQSGEYGYGMPYSSSASVTDSDQPGMMAIDAFNGTVALYTGPYDFDNNSGGWMTFSVNPIFGA